MKCAILQVVWQKMYYIRRQYLRKKINKQLDDFESYRPTIDCFRISLKRLVKKSKELKIVYPDKLKCIRASSKRWS